MLQTSLLHMKSLNKTETPIFLFVVCSLFPKAIFFTLILQARRPSLGQVGFVGCPRLFYLKKSQNGLNDHKGPEIIYFETSFHVVINKTIALRTIIQKIKV